MRHRKKLNHLGRKSAHRKETLSSLATSLILHKRINTTLAKAKALKVFVEPLITKSKVDSTHSRRTVFGYLRSKEAVSELFRDIAQKVADRPGGYTRILKTGFRKGDSAEMCLIELVDYNANMLKTEDDSKQRTTRRAGRRRKSGEEKADALQSKQEPKTKTAGSAAAVKASKTEEATVSKAEDAVQGVAGEVKEVAEEIREAASEIKEDAARLTEEVTATEVEAEPEAGAAEDKPKEEDADAPEAEEKK